MNQFDVNAVVISIVLGTWLMYRSIKKRKIARKIVDTPRSKVASAPQGYVELQGFAWPASENFEDTFHTPAGHEVVYYHLQLQRAETRGSGKNKRTEWVTVFSKHHAQPFYLIDATGLAQIDIIQSELSTESTKTRYWYQLSQKEKDCVISLSNTEAISGFPPSTFLFGLLARRFRTVEQEITLGSPLYVCGHFQTEHQGHRKIKVPGLTQFYSRIFNPEARAQKNLTHLLDKNGDRQVSAEEAKQGYSTAAKFTRKNTSIKIQEENEFEIFGKMSSSTEHKLLVADAHEEHLVQRMNRYVVLQFVGGATLLAFGLSTLLTPFIRPNRDSSNRAPVSIIDPAPWHEDCIKGRAEACEILLKKASDLNLTTDYIQFYKKQACQFRKSEHCL